MSEGIAPRRRGAWVALAAAALLIAVDAGFLLWSSKRAEARARAGTSAPAPQASTSAGAAPTTVVVPSDSPLRARLQISVTAAKPVRSELVAPASVEADPGRLAKVVPPLAGQVKQLLVRQGETVRKGQPLIALDSPDLVAARADFLRAQAVKVEAEKALRRQQDLLAHAVAAGHEVEEAQAAFDVAAQDLRRAQLRLGLLGADSTALDAPLTLRSPLSGQVLSLATAPGEFRNDLTAPLLVVADLAHLWVTASVPERDAERVHTGDEAAVRVAAFPDRELIGKVLFTENFLDPDTRTLKVRIQLENADGLLKPGMFATVVLRGAPTVAVVVPSAALFVDDRGPFVWIERLPWTFERRPVQVRAQQRDSVVVAGGLSPGERVVVTNGALLQ